MIYIVVILLVLVILIWFIFSSNKRSVWIDTEDYPEIEEIYLNRSDIKRELNSLINQNIWTIWRDKYEPSPTFTQMSRDEILKRVKNGKSELNKDSKSWKLYGLYLKGEPIDENLQRCPETRKLLKNIPNLINAGFSVLEPKSRIDPHRGYDDSFYRVHIPMVTPEGDCCLKVDGHTRKWRDSEYFIFDDTMEHEAWNNTDEIRIVMIMDIKK